LIHWSEIVDDVTFAFHVETAKRALNACSDIKEMRMVSTKLLEMMVYQRKVTQDLVQRAIKAEQSHLPRSAEKGS